MSRQDATREAKLEKRAALEASGINPHPYSFDKTHTIAQALVAKEDETIQTAGRLMQIRAHGKVIFADLADMSASIQLLIHKNSVPQEVWSFLKQTDRGDFIGVTGLLTTTKTGELTIAVSQAQFLGKALHALPSEWNAASDKEARFRKRYLDMLINPDAKRVLDARWLILKEVRRFLQDRHDFTEVETPILQPLYGGTNAKPFTTHMNALDCDFYLRLAPELYLKRLIIGGYDKIFEIARNFRNEGIDQTHQPEFTMIEWYEAYGDYNRMMSVAEELLQHLIEKLNGELSLEVGEEKIDVSGTWPKITMTESLKTYVGLDFNSLSDTQLQELLMKHNIELRSSFTRGKALFELFDELVTPHLISPTWIIDYPRDISPLAKQHRSKKGFAERFELYIAGKELADGWSEIVNGTDQREIFENEQRNMRDGDDEAHPLDEDFLEAMEHGMPPLCGIGMGIDRLVMFLTNTWSIKEVIAFPTLKPLGQQQEVQSSPTTTNESEIKSSDEKSYKSDLSLPPRQKAIDLLNEHIKNDKLQHHCYMVARAMSAYAKKLGEDVELWYQAGLLHDADWEAFPDEHPNKMLTQWLDEYPQQLKDAIAAHAPDRTGKKPQTLIERYLFACDELSGFLHALSILRPGGFEGMKFKSVKKKLKDKSFAAAVSREDITQGAQLIETELSQHVEFLISVFQEMNSDE